MNKECEEGTGGRKARQRNLIAKPGDQSEKPETHGTVYGEVLFFHQQRLATPLVFSNVLVAPHLCAVLPSKASILEEKMKKYLFINQLVINNYIWVVAEIFYW
ncbi:hypothetical protein PGO14_12665 [Klebsiella aerogenes]